MARVLAASIAVVVLLAGILIGLVAGRALGGTASAAPTTRETLVREQNLDANGYVRVHEQGVSDVNVLNFPVPQGRRLDLVFDNEPFAAGERKDSAFVDTEGCAVSKVYIHAGIVRVGAGAGGDVTILGSGDGVESYENLFPPSYVSSSGQNSTFAFGADPQRLRPWSRVHVFNGDTPQNITAYLYCVP